MPIQLIVISAYFIEGLILVSKKRCDPIRTCLVTGKKADRFSMSLLRFTVSPDNRIVYDINEKLHGRGVWISAHKDIVQKACDKQLFKRAFNPHIICSDTLADDVQAQLKAKLMQYMHFSRKASCLVSGTEKVITLLRKMRGKEIFLAASHEIGKDSIRRLHKEMLDSVLYADIFSTDELSNISGKPNSVLLAVSHHNWLVPIKKTYFYYKNFTQDKQ